MRMLITLPKTEVNPEIIQVSINVSDGTNPVEGAKVTFVGMDGTEYTGITGSAGGCTIKDVPEGTYHVIARCDGYVDTDPVQIEISAENNSLSIIMTKETEIIHVSVRDATDNEGIVGARVCLISNTEQSTHALGCVTGSAGGCNIKDVTMGTYDLSSTCGGYEDYEDTLEIIREDGEVQIIDGSGDKWPIINFKMVPLASHIPVNVSDGTNPVEGAKVTITDKTDSSKSFTTDNTTATGDALLENIPYGTYTVSVNAPEGYTALDSYDDFTVDVSTETLKLTVNKE